MADVEHKTLPDAELHEPKGIASAGAGKILVADGGGSGTWQGGNNFSAQHAGVNVQANTTVIAVPVAGDATLHTSVDYVPLPSSILSQDVASGITFDVNDAFVIKEAGIYIIQGWTSVSSSGTNNTVGFSYSINGTFIANIRPVVKLKLKVAGDIVTATGFGLVTLAAADVVRAGVADDTGTNVTLHEASFFIHKISN